MKKNFNATNHSDSQSLRDFLSTLDEDQLISITASREDYLTTAISEQLEAEKRFPVVELLDPHSCQKTVFNVFANREILDNYIKNASDVEQKAKQFSWLETLAEAPVQDVVTIGEDVNVLSLPIFRHFEGDAGRYITSGIVLAKDPRSGRYNMSFHRMQLKDENRMGISLHSRGDLYDYFEHCNGEGKDLEIAVIIGCHPAYYIAGASKIPATQDDYSWAGAYMDAVPQTVTAKTVDLQVPAFAEYILEGKILSDVFEDEGPFGEYTGYSTSRSTRNVFEVSSITQRKDAIYQDLVPGYAWEHLLLSQYSKEILLLKKLQKEIPEITGLSMPKNGCHFHAYMSMKPKAAGQAKQAMLLLFGLDMYLKLIIVVPDNVDVHNEDEVLWAVATHVQANRDVFIVPDVICNRLDPSSENGVSAKMGIDATNETASQEQLITIPDEIRLQARLLLKESD
ncbi:MAG: UbiD family decarboxylase [Eubacteriales bacterium]|nr:UbiD family decarboxylase [Eubacteriales bacterium]MDD4541065.1 UbiD family decarboxylase [Eubacteriales bacterium]